MPVAIADLMQQSGVAFGTSGARGRVEAMTDEVCFAYALAFAQHVHGQADTVLLAGDRRGSTARIVRAVAAAVVHAGLEPVYAGTIPTPALALHALDRCPAIMVTGSHIPEDRNGIKFYARSGEITKDDEVAIRARVVTLPASLPAAPALPLDEAAARGYRQRWQHAFGPEALSGRRIGVYGHSAVGRDLLLDVLRDAGAEVVPLGFSDTFVAVDTEAVRSEDQALARGWAGGGDLFAIVTTDGDGDRPMIADAEGTWLRGDVAGPLCARALGAQVLATPVSSSSVVELSGWFAHVERTRIGSPFVIEAMARLVAEARAAVAGYEANGGFLAQSPLRGPAGVLSPLPTRDAMPVILAVLHAAHARGIGVRELAAELPARSTDSDRVPGVPSAWSRARLEELAAGSHASMAAALGTAEVLAHDTTDGLRLQLAGGNIVHVRPSGNAPELRVYTEADSPAGARALLEHVLDRIRTRWLHGISRE